MKIYYDKDADLSLIKGKKVAIIGYGSQGHAHAQNLKDSGVKVTVGLRKGGASWNKAKNAGLEVTEVAEAVKGADIVMILLPDEHHRRRSTTKTIEPNIKKGASLAFAHGFNIHYGQIEPRADLDVIMIAPKAPGPHGALDLRAGRRRAVADRDPPGRVAARRATSRCRTRAAIGGGTAGVIETNFREETETDLFGEQAVLCGGTRRADQGRLRDAGRSRLRAGDGVLRVPARAEADRRPDLRRRHRQHELLDLQQRRVRRVRDAARSIVTDETKSGDEADA